MRLATLPLVLTLAVPSPAPPAPPSLHIESLTTSELAAAIRNGYTTVLIFSGSVEETGPHLVLGKHNLRAYAYGEQIARALGHTLVAPIIPFAPTADDLRRFPGTIDVDSATFSRVNEQVARSMAAAGFTRIIFLGDHAGNQGPLRALAPRLDAELRPSGTRVIFASDGYAKSNQEIEAYLKAHGYVASGHGGMWDTAELWAVDPHAVCADRLTLGDTSTADGSKLSSTGISGDPRRATPELGRRFAAIRVRNAVAEIHSQLGEAPSR